MIVATVAETTTVAMVTMIVATAAETIIVAQCPRRRQSIEVEH